MGGEDTDFDLGNQIPGLLNLADSYERHASEPSSSSSPTSSSSKSNYSNGREIPRAPHRPRAFPGSLPGATGGYAGTEGQADWALEREMEIIRLEDENRALRELLAISEESSLAAPVVEPEEEPKHSPIPDYSARRKSSLTIDELEADAEREEQAVKDREMFERDLAGSLPRLPPTAIEKRTDFDDLNVQRPLSPSLEGGGPRRPVMTGSVLGFQPQTPPPEQAIDDSET